MPFVISGSADPKFWCFTEPEESVMMAQGIIENGRTGCSVIKPHV